MQVIGVPDQAEKDEVVKSVMDLKSAEIEEGYSMDAVGYRQVGASNCKCLLGEISILCVASLSIIIFILISLFVAFQVLLTDVRDKLLFELEYAGNIKEKIPPKSSLRIPWAWLPGALCLLQEVHPHPCSIYLVYTRPTVQLSAFHIPK